MQKNTVFFLRGTSTKGQENIQFGALSWGPMHAHLQRELHARGISVKPILGLGPGLHESQVENALEFLRNHPDWNSGGKLHLLGHSAGGIIGKMIVARLNPEESLKISSLTTIACPHRGGRLADMVMTAPDRHPFLTWFLRKFIRYDIHGGFPFYEELTPRFRSAYLEKWRPPAHLKTASVICSAPRKKWSWPMILTLLFPTMWHLPAPSDGLLELSSQTFGQVIGEFELDHLTQLGVYNKPQFAEMCDCLAKFYSEDTQNSLP